MRIFEFVISVFSVTIIFSMIGMFKFGFMELLYWITQTTGLTNNGGILLMICLIIVTSILMTYLPFIEDNSDEDRQQHE